MKGYIERMAMEEKKSMAYGGEFWTDVLMRHKREAAIVVATLIAIILVAVFLFDVLPGAYGNNYVSIMWEIGVYGHYDTNGPFTMNVSVPAGVGRDSPYSGPCNYISPTVIYVFNSYFIPVRIHGNEFEDLYLIYNHTVSDPGDVEANKRYLVWGAYFTYSSPIVSFEDKSAYGYYVARRTLSNYTQTVVPGCSKYCPSFDINPSNNIVWYGQDLNGKPVPPGTYYLYYICMGIVAKPAPITINVTALYPWWW